MASIGAKRTTAAGSTASSRFSAIFTAVLIAFTLDRFGIPIAAAMLAVALLIGLRGPRTRTLALGKISH